MHWARCISRLCCWSIGISRSRSPCPLRCSFPFYGMKSRKQRSRGSWLIEGNSTSSAPKEEDNTEDVVTAHYARSLACVAARAACFLRVFGMFLFVLGHPNTFLCSSHKETRLQRIGTLPASEVRNCAKAQSMSVYARSQVRV